MKTWLLKNWRWRIVIFLAIALLCFVIAPGFFTGGMLAAQAGAAVSEWFWHARYDEACALFESSHKANAELLAHWGQTLDTNRQMMAILDAHTIKSMGH